ncbi:GNAT family N-acetyltransferase [Gordonia hydrophobica]|uniref:N-acetyltransferase n=1 Tax=Gordonia hydrophobica TaxID=40516 RepID=A0ABZ2TYG8_9ACTN|nr:N-acetyltransferase [Gordonia hydrophobica]MBM7367103.1 ribosomal protein S18 acetylase RimI-like enzyme [Gordonia hydrophobica]
MSRLDAAPIRIAPLPAELAHLWLDPAVHTYITAMNYPRGSESHRLPLWRDHIARPGWTAYGAFATLSRLDSLRPTYSRLRVQTPLALSDTEALVGVAYGYRGAGDQWWHRQLYSGLLRAGVRPDDARGFLRDYFELTELHVHPAAQGRRIGEHLLASLLSRRTEAKVLLSTPEVADEGNRAWGLYRRLGFSDVLRHFTFVGDARPFAFLGRPLPLDAPAADLEIGC